MSDIIKARELLHAIVVKPGVGRVELKEVIYKALNLMYRVKPKSIAARKNKPLTLAEKRLARRMRKEGMQLSDIAYSLKVNPGRISEATQ